MAVRVTIHTSTETGEPRVEIFDEDPAEVWAIVYPETNAAVIIKTPARARLIAAAFTQAAEQMEAARRQAGGAS